mmetsp:Transcript_19095/g.64503  ORF Transcript_19095/g.64503 Transcript_19095/m.64503 type:complete len:245 (-) Transcript_19095:2827-3561(-)
MGVLEDASSMSLSTGFEPSTVPQHGRTCFLRCDHSSADVTHRKCFSPPERTTAKRSARENGLWISCSHHNVSPNAGKMATLETMLLARRPRTISRLAPSRYHFTSASSSQSSTMPPASPAVRCKRRWCGPRTSASCCICRCLTASPCLSPELSGPRQGSSTKERPSCIKTCTNSERITEPLFSKSYCSNKSRTSPPLAASSRAALRNFFSMQRVSASSEKSYSAETSISSSSESSFAASLGTTA